MLVAGIIFILLGTVIWYLSRLGFAVGSHPFCRACGFDLYKLPEDSTRCSECGADVLAEGAITIGHRRPVRWGMAAGGVGLLIGVLMVASAGAAYWDRFDGSRYKTVRMLERDMLLPMVRTRARACAELQRRIEEQSLTGMQMEHLAREVLKRQSDPNWDPQWGDLVQAGHAAREAAGGPLLGDTLWEQFLRQGMDITMRARPKVRSGDPIPIALACRLKVGTMWLEPATTFTPEIAASCGSRSGQVTGQPQVCNYPVCMEWTTHWQPEGDLGTGTQQVTVTVTMTARAGNSAATRTKVFSVPVEVLDREDNSVSLRAPTASTRQEFEAALHWRLREAEDGTISLEGGTLGKLWVAAPPVAAAFRVVLRQGEGSAMQEWVIGRFVVATGDAMTVPLALPSGVVLEPGNAEIALLPDRSLAEGTVDVLEVWGEAVSRKIKLVR